MPVSNRPIQKVAIDDIEPSPNDENIHTDRRNLTDPLNTDHVAVVRYALAPGERFSGSVHAHMDQKEVFVVLAGETTFDTRSGEIAVEAGEAIRFGPGEFQSGHNAGEEDCLALALGAPRDSEDIRIASIPVLNEDVSCPDCGHDHMRVGEGGLVCPECSATITVE